MVDLWGVGKKGTVWDLSDGRAEDVIVWDSETGKGGVRAVYL